MNLSELQEIVDHLVDDSNNPYSLSSTESKVVIPVKSVGSIGGREFVDIKNITVGFDWDAGKIFMNPSKDLRIVDVNEYEQMQKSCEELGWSVYENANLKKEIKTLRAKLKENQND